MAEQQNKPFKIKLHSPLDQAVAAAITAATLAAIDDRLYRLTAADIGKDIKGEGIYLGTYVPVDREGVSLKKVFNVFAAPEDLPETMKYADTVKYIAKLKKWHGHDGANYAADKELYAALKDGSYNGGWIIPPCDILYGKDADDKETATGNIFALAQENSIFRNTFKASVASGSGSVRSKDWYWSSTKDSQDPAFVTFVDFSDGRGWWDFNGIHGKHLSCRPVRLVEKVL